MRSFASLRLTIALTATILTSFAANESVARLSRDATGTITEYRLRYAPSGITAGPDGALWFTESNYPRGKVGRISTTGQVTQYAVPSGYPVRITVGPDGALWFTAQIVQGPPSSIGRITTTGQI